MRFKPITIWCYKLVVFIFLSTQISIGHANDLVPTIILDAYSGLNQNTVFAIGEDSLGAIWIGTPGGLFRYNGFEVTTFDSINSTVLSIHQRGAFIYCVTLVSVYKIDCRDLSLRSYEFREKDYYRATYSDAGIRLIGQHIEKDFILDYNLKKISQKPEIRAKLRPTLSGLGECMTGPSGVKLINKNDTLPVSKSYSSGCTSLNNSFWVSTHSGLLQIYLENNEIHALTHFTNERIECVYKDSRGHLWVGTAAKGVYMIHRNTLNSEFTSIVDKSGHPIPSWGLFDFHGETYVCTNDGIKPVEHLGIPNKLTTMTAAIHCNTAISNKGLVLIGTASQGLLRYTNGNLIQVYKNDLNALDNTIMHIIQTSDEFIACTKLGWIRVSDKGDFIESIPYKTKGISPYVMWMRRKGDGYQCTTTTGVYLLDKNFNILAESTSPEARVFNMCDDDFCVSMDGGLFRLDENNKLDPVRFPDRQLQFVLDKTWIGSTTAIYHYSSETIQAFGKQNGFPLAEYNQGGAFMNLAGKLFVSGVGGVFCFESDSVLNPLPLPYLRILDRSQLPLTTNIKSKPHQNLVSVYIEPLAIADQNRYEIIINDSISWDVSGLKQIDWNIPYGNSNLKIEVQDKYTNRRRQYHFSIIRGLPFWRQWWFYLLSIMALVLSTLGIFSIYKYIQTRRLLKMQEAENKVNQERLRISKELHDNIGARLAHIISSLDVEIYKAKEDADPIERISVFARETMSQLRETIWAVGDKTIHFSEFVHRVEQYVHQADKLSHIKLDFKSEVIFDFELKPIETINYFRIVQEAMSNALKYSSSKHISIQIQPKSQFIEVQISDDGQGFDMNLASLGTGIKGMHTRAEEAGAVVNINSTLKKGTIINLLIPIK